MNKRTLIMLWFTVWLVSLLGANAQTVNERPNILWIVSEDNSTMLGCYGDKFATTPNLDAFAKESVLFENAFSQPACALSRSTLITGMLGSSLGIEPMRSTYPIPGDITFFPKLLRKAGYYTSNNAKEDYNTPKQKDAWDQSNEKASYKNRKPGQPFFSVFNIGITHESGIHKPAAKLNHKPDKVPIPPYLPSTPEMRHDWALYYDKIEAMDKQVANLLAELDEAGLAENTIVFYYSDNGGVLGRSKRFLYDAGLHVPLIVRIPDKFSSLRVGAPGSRIAKLVSFEDFAPTVLKLAGLNKPGYMQGNNILESGGSSEKKYVYGFRGRIDETIEMSRTIRSEKYRYIRNYMPHKVYGQHNEYYWQAKSIVSWENSFRAGLLNEAQSAFWKEKPTEELYDVEKDPFNVHNLAGEKQYAAVLSQLRKDFKELLLKTHDAGFIPESMRVDISKNSTVYDYSHSENYPLQKIFETAEMASSRDFSVVDKLTSLLLDKSPVVRYWAATGFAVLGKLSPKGKSNLLSLLNDEVPAVRIAAAEALANVESANAIKSLTQNLLSENIMVRVEALTVLEKLGLKAEAAKPAIEAMILKRDDKKNPGQPLWKYDHDLKIAKRIISNL